MKHRPKRENYPSGKYGDIDYLEMLERYCTYLENKINIMKYSEWRTLTKSTLEELGLQNNKDDFYKYCKDHSDLMEWCDDLPESKEDFKSLTWKQLYRKIHK